MIKLLCRQLLLGMALLVLLASFVANASEETCGPELRATSTTADGTNFLLSQGEGQHELRVFHTPTLYQLQKLGYSHIGHVRRKKILLLGDGFSGFALALQNAGKDVTSVDLAYGQQYDPEGLNDAALEMISTYEEQLGDRLIGAPASETGLEKGSFQLILSHMLLNNIPSDQEKARVIAHAASLLRTNGEARFVAWNRDVDPNVLKQEVRTGPVMGMLRYMAGQGWIKPGFKLKFSEIASEYEDGKPYFHMYYSVRFVRTNKRIR
ncbi:MAG: class I SAM-dependent methyltransferase [Bdellovibrionales bacterium]|nr:class I SAM-dependent methyltransferase [Bdellovibrionales bacterium]